MNKEIEYIEKLKIELGDLHKKIQNINPFENSREYDYLTYKIEILKRDILIEQLRLPLMQKAMLEPMKPLLIDKNLIDGIYISNKQAKELLEDVESLKYLKVNPIQLKAFRAIYNKLKQALGGKDE